ncbi:uncharacterized protein CEXT_532241 [Caerostris extrusa]|uniref:Uncharacterized protein n=1 Tax=Caerostris extrusa TaxID=172846 RepID=A0AAV4NBQ2_CAEEX|nr:uncharacterized protein CEXT_532241 [Caerostris extrusa]
MQDIFNHLLYQHNNDPSIEETKRLLEIYESISKATRKFDECFSFPTFIATVMNLSALFWTGYSVVFVTDTSLYVIAPVIYFLSHHLLLMISASMANEKVVEAKLIIKCLLRHCHLQTRMKIKYEKNMALKSNLTLWKIYVFDRSLLITSFGCLLTYGILFATLGREH